MANEESAFYAGISRYHAIVIGDNKTLLNPLRSALKSIGFPTVTPFATFTDALESSVLPSCSHVLFDAATDDLPGLEFVNRAVALNRKVIMIVITFDPAMDNVFDLIKAGARGFLVPPPTMESVESVLVSATSGPPISELILKADDRNNAFAVLILNVLFRAASARKEAATSRAAAVMADRFMAALQGAVATARMFCERGNEGLREALIEECIRRADRKKTRLGELRQNLRSQRQV